MNLHDHERSEPNSPGGHEGAFVSCAPMDAIILAGGVAKGAFTAGALEALFDPYENPAPPRVRRIVAASSGALNAAYLAAAVRRDDEHAAGVALSELWVEHATVRGAFAPSVAGVFTLEGFSSGDKILDLLRANILPQAGPRAIDLRLIVTSAAGEVRPGETPPATTFEHVLSFDEGTFASRRGLDQLFAGVVASCAFPVAFLPAPVRIGSAIVPCFDGGMTNNTPVRYALGRRDISRLYVISPYPKVATPSPVDMRGPGLLAHLADILVNERLYRDVREAQAVNRALARLELEFPAVVTRERALQAIGWEGRKQIEIVEIRPAQALEGNAFDGFFSRQLRETYVRAGKEAAREWLRLPVAA